MFELCQPGLGRRNGALKTLSINLGLGADREKHKRVAHPREEPAPRATAAPWAKLAYAWSASDGALVRKRELGAKGFQLLQRVLHRGSLVSWQGGDFLLSRRMNQDKRQKLSFGPCGRKAMTITPVLSRVNLRR